MSEGWDRNTRLKLPPEDLNQGNHYLDLGKKIVQRVGQSDFINRQLAQNDLSRLSFIKVVGNSPDLNNSDNIIDINTITPPKLYVFPTVAAIFTIVSDSALDTLGGTGAQTASLIYLDENFDEQIVPINLNGITPVNTIITGLRVNDFRIVLAGTTNQNMGTITVAQGANVLGQINPGEGKSLSSIYTIPNNTDGFLTKLAARLSRAPTSSSSVKEVKVIFKYKPFNGAWTVIDKVGLASNGGPYEPPTVLWDKFLPKTDIRVEAEPLSNGVSVTIDYELLLQDITP